MRGRNRPVFTPSKDEEVRIAEPRLADTAKSDMKMLMVCFKLLNWVGKSHVPIAKIGVAWNALLGDSVVRVDSEPFKVGDEPMGRRFSDFFRFFSDFFLIFF